MAGSLDLHALEVGHPSLHAERLLGPEHEIEFGGDHQSGLIHPLGQIGRLLPVAVNVAIPIESAAKAGLLESLHVNVELGLAHVLDQRPVGKPIEQSAAGGTEYARRRPLCERRKWNGIAIKTAQRSADIALEFGLSNAGLLEVKRVVEIPGGDLPRHLGRLERRGLTIGHPHYLRMFGAARSRRKPSRHERRIEVDYACDPRRRTHRALPADKTAPVMADDRAPVDFERVEHSNDVVDQFAHPVSLDRLRTIGFTVAALVGRDSAKAGGGECGNLMAPGVPELGEAVAENHREALARLDDVHPDAVGFDELVDELAHRILPPDVCFSVVAYGQCSRIRTDQPAAQRPGRGSYMDPNSSLREKPITYR